jgi:hypothetical protein
MKRSASRFGPDPSLLEAKEEVLNAVACQESTQTKNLTLKAKKTKAEPARCHAVLEQGARSSVSRAFIRTTRREPPEQEDTKSSPSSLMELKFELDTRLTVSCVVAAASGYGLLTVSIALDSILLAFGNAVILLLILFVLFGWRELLGEFNKKRSTSN